jgi:hypothetical protein
VDEWVTGRWVVARMGGCGCGCGCGCGWMDVRFDVYTSDHTKRLKRTEIGSCH